MSEDQKKIDYYRIAAAIDFLNQNFQQQPSLDEIAQHINLSAFHFQRLFNRWAGVSPKKFIQYLTVNYAKKCLADKALTLFDTAHNAGLSSTSRLHDLFVNIEAMTPAEFRNGGKALLIRYQYASTFLGDVLIASTSKGICSLAFTDNRKAALDDLLKHYPKAEFKAEKVEYHQKALSVLYHRSLNDQIPLHIKGTSFQLKVWEALLKIPLGDLSTYGKLANEIGSPKGSRAVGTAIGSNPIAFLIPCHRVIRASGEIGGYRWEPTRKSAILGWEAARNG